MASDDDFWPPKNQGIYEDTFGWFNEGVKEATSVLWALFYSTGFQKVYHWTKVFSITHYFQQKVHFPSTILVHVVPTSRDFCNSEAWQMRNES